MRIHAKVTTEDVSQENLEKEQREKENGNDPSLSGNIHGSLREFAYGK